MSLRGVSAASKVFALTTPYIKFLIRSDISTYMKEASGADEWNFVRKSSVDFAIKTKQGNFALNSGSADDSLMLTLLEVFGSFPSLTNLHTWSYTYRAASATDVLAVQRIWQNFFGKVLQPVSSVNDALQAVTPLNKRYIARKNRYCSIHLRDVQFRMLHLWHASHRIHVE